MDVVLGLADQYVFTPYVYPASVPEDALWRQFLSLNVVATLGGALIYLITATFSYVFIFNKELMKHPHILENQIQKEITFTLRAVPWMGVLTAVVFVFEVRGYSKLYDNVDEYGWWFIGATVVAFILFTDCIIYWMHRGFHHKHVYKYIHKDHHKWKVPTPYASHAFHPLDGFLQSSPYHLYVFLFPMHKYTYLIMYVLVNFWTVSIHDGDYRVPKILQPFINGSAHHTDHHLFYNYNYGQYFTLWDKIGSTFRHPSSFEGKGPLDEVKRRAATRDVTSQDRVTSQNGVHTMSNGKKTK